MAGTLLALAMLGYICYQNILRPAAGFPSDDMGVILAGINTLRFGHGLKFLEAIAVALLATGLYLRLNLKAPLAAQLISLLGTGSVALLILSGILGLRILGEAESIFASNPVDARTLILIRTVTIALFDGALLMLGLLVLAASWAGWKDWPGGLLYLGLAVSLVLLLRPLSELVAAIDLLWKWLGPALVGIWGIGLGFHAPYKGAYTDYASGDAPTATLNPPA
jgi:hypothetical protein